MSKLNQQTIQKIDTMVKDFFDPATPEWKKGLLEEKIFQYCMVGVGLERYASAGRIAGNMDNDPQSKFYDGEGVTKAWEYACKNFAGQGFFSLFQSAFNVKSRGFMAEYMKQNYGNEQVAKAAEVNAFLKRKAKERGLKPAKKDFNVLNKERLTAYMWANGYTLEDVEAVVNPATGILAQSYVSGEDSGAKQDGEKATQSLAIAAQIYNDYSAVEQAQDGFAYTLEKTAEAVSGTQKEAMLRYVITWGVEMTGYYDPNMDCVDDLVDEGFRQFLFENLDFVKVVDAITAYTGKKRDTVRKDVALLGHMLHGEVPEGGCAA